MLKILEDANMMLRATVVWFLILLFAVLNGGVREGWLIPRFGELKGRALSTILLCILVLASSWFTIGWIRPSSTGEALKVGVLWLVLTLGFEFLVGHYVFGNSWAALLEDYNVSRGRLWILVPLLVLVAPLMMARMKRLLL
jgi:hypothetical protein